MKKRYVLMKFQAWDNLEAWTPSRQPIMGVKNTSGMLLVYDTLKSLRKDNGRNAPYAAIKPKE